MADYTVIVMADELHAGELYRRLAEKGLPEVRILTAPVNNEGIRQIVKLKQEGDVDLIVADVCLQRTENLTALSGVVSSNVPFALVSCEPSSHPALRQIVPNCPVAYRNRVSTGDYWAGVPAWLMDTLDKLPKRELK